MNELQIQIVGMTCSACSTRIEKALLRMEGMQQAAVSLATSTAGVRWEGHHIRGEQVLERIRNLGYGAAIVVRDTRPSHSDEAEFYRRRFWITTMLSLPLFLAMAAHLFSKFGMPAPALLMHPLLQLTLGSILLSYAGYPFFRGAFHALRQGMPNMDVLVALGTTVAYLYSQYQTFRSGSPHALYFDSIAMVLTAVTLGKWLEAIAKGNALRSLEALSEMRPQTASVVRDDGLEVVASGQLEAGDRVVVGPLERVPADGVIEEGTAEVDESLLTGESAVTVRNPGERLFAGTRLVGGSAMMRVERSGALTRLATMIALVETAQLSKPRIARRVDRIAAFFVPGILLLAVLTCIAYLRQGPADEAVGIAMAVLLTACPCALGLATPISLMIASGMALKEGIVIKDAGLLETLSHADAFIFDKSGTLTYGRPAVKGIEGDWPSDQLLQLAASIEQLSTHPYAQAVVREAGSRELQLFPVDRFIERPGFGVSGTVEGMQVVIGSVTWLHANNIRLPVLTPNANLASALDPVVHVAINGRVAGLIRLQEEIREDAGKTVRALSVNGVVWMATGDREQVATRIGALTGIRHVRAGLLPEQKLDLLQEIRAGKRRVVMIGDGANDSAALAAADVGIALASGHAAALETGDIVIVGGRLSQVSEVYTLARRTMRNIRQNLFLALIYNAVMIPLAVSGMLDPRLACIGMASSSLLVVGNAVRLRSTVPGRRSRRT
ncbi:heavy metal translocating P-type ATPase [Cohnella hashimotonis]|uniref:P-type Cu(+) transporter n=1 Tax=Cohnella hashimotonis TaxID=2826895 RepID=A0ABT6TKW4_9BACL|nr:cation-translocating P-type ATPase [Cohnella hashimotonis]MDI4647375.1 cation-translocating P-type ATPase [Cohnella hashimotonis]